MLNKLNNAPKSIKLSQYIFIIFVVLYLIESIFIRGLFTNFYLFFSTIILGCISTIIALFKKTYLFAAIDVALIIACFLVFGFLISL